MIGELQEPKRASWCLSLPRYGNLFPLMPLCCQHILQHIAFPLDQLGVKTRFCDDRCVMILLQNLAQYLLRSSCEIHQRRRASATKHTATIQAMQNEQPMTGKRCPFQHRILQSVLVWISTSAALQWRGHCRACSSRNQCRMNF